MDVDVEGHHELQILLRCSVVVLLHFSFAFLIAPDEYKAGWRRGVRGSERCWVWRGAGFGEVLALQCSGVLRCAGFAAVQWDHRRNSCSNSGLVFCSQSSLAECTQAGEKRAEWAEGGTAWALCGWQEGWAGAGRDCWGLQEAQDR